MIPIVTREQMRAYDTYAIDKCNVPGIVLMENAGSGAAEVIADHTEAGPVVLVCGRGNNGGDGFVAARHLLAHQIEADVFVLGERDAVSGDAKLALDALIGIGGPVSFLDDDLSTLAEALDDADLAVDAMFGTGLTRAVEGAFAAAVALLDDALCPVVALDIPSGIDADTGAVLGCAPHADVTVTFAHLKAGLVQSAGARHAGDIEVVDLGIPDASILDEVGYLAIAIDSDDVADTLGERAFDVHKYTAGNVLIVAGSQGKTGAAWLAAEGALRSGAGLATIATWPDAVDSLEQRVREAMTFRLDPKNLEASLAVALERRAVVAVGPGLGLSAEAREVTHALLAWEGPVILDADAITHLAEQTDLIKKSAGPRVLTPHSGELGRLLGITSGEVEADRFAAASRAAAATGATVVLKGPHTIVATPGQTTEICLAGHAVLATAGSGDVLTGIVAALACGSPVHDAACAAVYLHAISAERWHQRVGADRGMLASEIAAEIPRSIASMSTAPEIG